MTLREGELLIKTTEDLRDFVAVEVIVGALQLCDPEGMPNHKARVQEIIKAPLAGKLLQQGFISPLRLATLGYACVLEELVRDEKVDEGLLNERIREAGLLVPRMRLDKSVARRAGISETDRVRALQEGITSVHRLVYGHEVNKI